MPHIDEDVDLQVCQGGPKATAHVVLIDGGPVTRVEQASMPQIISEVRADLANLGITEPRILQKQYSTVADFVEDFPLYLVKIYGADGCSSTGPTPLADPPESSQPVSRKKSHVQPARGTTEKRRSSIGSLIAGFRRGSIEQLPRVHAIQEALPGLFRNFSSLKRTRTAEDNLVASTMQAAAP